MSDGSFSIHKSYKASKPRLYTYIFCSLVFKETAKILKENISQLSNINLDEIKKLFLYCENIKQAPSLTENDLQELNRRITNVKNQSAR